jgi:hypothetical protein
MTSLRILYDTGRENLTLRVACVAWGAFCLAAAWLARSNTNVGMLAAALVGLCFICAWFVRARLSLDLSARELIWCSAFFGVHRTSLEKAVAVSAHQTGVLTKSSSIYLHFSDGRRALVLSVGVNHSERVVDAISEATSLAIIR